jgi:hypothetical protein
VPQRAHLEVNKEDDNAKVNKGVGSRDQVGLAVQHEDDRGHKASLGIAEKRLISEYSIDNKKNAAIVLTSWAA